MAAGLITLTTDFGASDWFAGVMKGVILSINPRASVIDLNHGIAPGDLVAGAFSLEASYRCFPADTIHVVVVDPGVGSARQAIGVRTSRCLFVGPDNGVLSRALQLEKVRSVHALTNRDYFLQPLSRTFHGRDVFAPVAAHLSRGAPLTRFGPALPAYRQLLIPQPKRTPQAVRGQVVYIDGFGNGITNLDHQTLTALGPSEPDILVGRKRIGPIAEYYQAVPPGQPVAVPGSTGFLEIAVNGGNAARRLNLRVGTPVTARKARARG